MLFITLSQGQVAVVDDADYPLLSDFRWSYRAERNGKQGYAVRHMKVDGKDRLCYMHRQIMQPPTGYEVIFLNHDRLDYRRENLCVVSKEEARQHHRVRRDSKSGTKGVRYNPESESWSAYVYRGCVRRSDHPYPAFVLVGVVWRGRFAAGRGRLGSRSNSQLNRLRGFLPKKRSAAVVPSARSVR